jgi:SAM-dependent methyltransferase
VELGSLASEPDADLTLLISILRWLVAFPIRLSLLGFKRSEHDAIRFSMYETLRDFVPRHVIRKHAEVLAIGNSWVLANMVAPNSNITEANYPEYNILSLPFANDSFDVVVTDQVLEHVEGDPFVAVEECRRVLKSGGIAVHTAPLLIQIHGFPSDYWRFTPDGLSLLCRTHSEVLLAGGWGNRFLWLLSWSGVLFGRRVPLAKWHPYHRAAVINEPDYPIAVWVVARK